MKVLSDENKFELKIGKQPTLENNSPVSPQGKRNTVESQKKSFIGISVNQNNDSELSNKRKFFENT